MRPFFGPFLSAPCFKDFWVLTSRIDYSWELVNSMLYIKPPIFPFFIYKHPIIKLPLCSCSITLSFCQALKLLSILQEIKVFKHSPLKIKDSWIQDKKGFYERSIISIFKISFHKFKILCYIFYIHPFKIYIHLHAFLQ